MPSPLVRSQRTMVSLGLRWRPNRGMAVALASYTLLVATLYVAAATAPGAVLQRWRWRPSARDTAAAAA